MVEATPCRKLLLGSLCHSGLLLRGPLWQGARASSPGTGRPARPQLATSCCASLSRPRAPSAQILSWSLFTPKGTHLDELCLQGRL